MRNLVRRTYRTERRRDRRERAAARHGTALSAGDSAERLEVVEGLVRAVRALPALYRDVVVRRYFDGRRLAEIAAEDGDPPATVRSRHRRALEMLREELDARNGSDRSAWIAALLPLATPPRPPGGTGPGAALATGALVSAKKIGALAAGLLVLAAGLALLLRSRGAEPPSPLPAGSGTPTAGAGGPDGPAPPDLTAARTGIRGEVRRAGFPAAARVELRIAAAVTEDELSPALGRGEPVAATTAGEDGGFLLGSVPAGHYEVRAVAADGVAGARTVHVPEGGPTIVVTIDVPAGTGVVKGVASFSDGRPFPGLVFARAGSAPHAYASLPETVDAEGRFVLRGLPSGRFRLVLLLPGRLRVEGATFQVPFTTRLRVVVDEGLVSVSGTVVDAATGEPVPGSRVTAGGREPRRGRSSLARGETDPEGRFRLPVLPSGAWLTVEAEGFEPWAREIGAEAGGLEVRLERGASVSGRVVDATGKPVGEVLVRAHPLDPGYDVERRTRTARTDPAGGFTLDALRPGNVLFVILDRGWASRGLEATTRTASSPLVVALAPGGPSISMDLEPGLSITGRILAPAGSDEMMVRARGLAVDVPGTVDAAGRFEIRGLPEGRFRVTAEVSFPGRWRSGSVEAESGDSVEIEVN